MPLVKAKVSEPYLELLKLIWDFGFAQCKLDNQQGSSLGELIKKRWNSFERKTGHPASTSANQMIDHIHGTTL